MDNSSFNELNGQIARCVHDLMMRHDCVVIPGFGAFIGNYRPANLHPVTHLLQAPSKQFVFNRNLVKDDGLLTGTFASITGNDFGVARELISGYAGELKNRLHAGEKITLRDVGLLSDNIEGVTIFKPENSVNLLPEAFGLSPVQLSLIIREPIPERRPAPEFVNREVVVEAKKGGRRLAKTLLRTAPVLLIGALLSINALMPSEKRVNFSDLSFGTGIKNTLAPAILGTHAAGTPKARKALVLPVAESDFTAESAKIYLVAGCYSSRSNADGMVDYLLEKGFDAALLDLTPGGLYRVVYGSYADISAASEELDQIKKGFNEEAWMLIK
ncbi:MAG: SPOR domain-containing protein [Bacteroidetes bacterium]|nr:SPOR domain-containing protein [Bacteroidota bacterium]